MFIDEAKIAVTLSHANIVQVFDLGQARRAPTSSRWSTWRACDLGRDAQARRAAASGASARSSRSTSSASWPRGSTTRTAGATPSCVRSTSCTATSRRRTCCSASRARSSSPTSASRRRARVRPGGHRVGVVKGKFAYMAPEQLLGEDVDARDRRVRAGALLYEALAGVNPFQAASSYDTLQRIRSGRGHARSRTRARLADEVARIVRTAPWRTSPDRVPERGRALRRPDPVSSTARAAASAPTIWPSYSRQYCAPAAADDTSRAGEGLKAAFEVDIVRRRTSGAPERTRVGRGREPTRERKARRPTRAPTSQRERAEWRDVTALAAASADAAISTSCWPTSSSASAAALVGRRRGYENRSRGDRRRCWLFRRESIPMAATPTAPRSARCAWRARRAPPRPRRGAPAAWRSTLWPDACWPTSTGSLSRTTRSTSFCGVALRAGGQGGGEGQILVDADGEKALRNRFRLVPCLQAAWPKTRTCWRASAAWPRRTARFIGRAHELRAVGESLGARQPRELRSSACRARPGSGKSRLLMETMRRLGLAGHSVGLHVATLTPQMRDAPLSAIQEMLRVVLGVDEFDSEALVRGRTIAAARARLALGPNRPRSPPRWAST